MSAEPMHAPVTYLPMSEGPPPADPRDGALAELALALDTQRSANRAMVAAVKDLDRMLSEQRGRTEELEAQLVEYTAAVTHQVSENKRLWCDVRLAEHRLAEELEKPLWRRVLKR